MNVFTATFDQLNASSRNINMNFIKKNNKKKQQRLNGSAQRVKNGFVQ